MHYYSRSLNIKAFFEVKITYGKHKAINQIEAIKVGSKVVEFVKLT